MSLSQILAILLQIHSDRGSNSEQQISICQNIFFFNSRTWVFKCVCMCVFAHNGIFIPNTYERLMYFKQTLLPAFFLMYIFVN